MRPNPPSVPPFAPKSIGVEPSNETDLKSGIWQQVQQRLLNLRAPLYRNSIYLFAATIISAGCGFLFWLLGARATTPANIGIAQATLGSAFLLIALSDLGLGTAMPFYAARSSEPGEFVNASIFAGWLFSSLAVVIFWMGIPLFAPNLVGLRSDPLMLPIFFLFTTINFVLGMQDAAMLSQRNGRYVFLRMLACNIPPTLLLFLLLFVEHSYRIVLIAYGLPNIVVGLWVGWRLFPKVFANYRLLGRPDFTAILKMTRFGLSNYVGNLLWGLPGQLLPLITINALSPTIAGYFLTNFTLVTLVLAIPRTAATSMFIEGARNSERLASISLNSLMFILAIAAPVILGVSVLGSFVISLFGRDYVMMTSLRLMMLSVLPFTVNTVLMNFFRLQRAYWTVIIFSGLVTGSVLLSINLMAPLNGADGIALGMVIGYSIPALLGTLWVAQSLWRQRTLRRQVVS